MAFRLLHELAKATWFRAQMESVSSRADLLHGVVRARAGLELAVELLQALRDVLALAHGRRLRVVGPPSGWRSFGRTLEEIAPSHLQSTHARKPRVAY